MFTIIFINMKWTKEEQNKAIQLLKTRIHSFEDIAVSLGRTKKSVKEKFRKLGFIESDYYERNFKEDKSCENCGTVFTALISEDRKYCTKSCAITVNNTLRERKPNEKYNSRKRREYHQRKNKKCLHCGVDVKNKYCSSSCQAKYRWTLIIKKIEDGDTTLYYRHYKRYLIQKHGERCMDCGWGETNTHSGNIPIELEHIDGDSTNNCIDNLKLLCPNCHSLTPTYKGLNIGNGRYYRRDRYNKGLSY